MSQESSINIGGLSFQWNLEKGQFKYEGEDAVLFWISSAMKTLFDSIEEISGLESASLVLETTGFRQGLVVGEYFQKMKLNISDVAKVLPNTYGSAGWGEIVIKELDPGKKSILVQLKNSWEYKINQAQGKTKAGSFMPAHYAGIFSGLFGTNIWYEIRQSQIEGKDHDIVEYFPSDITVTKNIHQLARQKETEQIQMLEAVVEDKTRELQGLVKELSSPIIPVLEGVVVVPLLGRYDEARSTDLIEKTLNNLPKYQADYLILDLTGLDKDLSDYTAHFIHKLGSTANLIGMKTILVGISPELSIIISNSNTGLAQYDCFQTLQHGIYYALGQAGRKII
ncbi:anti-anti-sigma regulatory factor [Peribacillus deserti]|uniref:Anti-anti-sigma regulatory factor n=1 Tax=Peribacillus deserti TaxID=673318 RepID=A0ABS2QPK6_9BACI|nr:STAS domain-containing protein [Peribacillus deserti]MBM7694403.1 anti-anti-sigma regulatory factor [Peribacillus deserti]